jgi:hypothetical protein
VAIVAPTAGLYPSIETVNNQIRALVNDTFAGATSTEGEGRVYRDNWTPNITILNLALQSLQRDLETYGLPTTREVATVISNSLSLTLSAAALASASGNTVYTGTITGGAGNALVGLFFNVTGFALGGNNIIGALCVGSSITTLTLVNPNGAVETHAGVATSGALTPLNGPLGLGVADPAVTPYLSFQGYWDGTVLHPAPALPQDLLIPLKIRGRVSGSSGVFTEIHEAPNGLPSVVQTALGLGRWEWFRNQINFNGSLATMDIELRYTGGCPQYSTSLSPTLYATTLIPFLDAGDALAYKGAYIYCAPRLPKGGASELETNYEQAMMNLAGRWMKPKAPAQVATAPQGGA